MARRVARNSAATTAKSARDRLSWDTQMLDVYLTGLQAEVEAKVRHVARFREQMQKIDEAGGSTDMAARRRAINALVSRIDEMLRTNLIVRGTLEELRTVAVAALDDVKALERSAPTGR